MKLLYCPECLDVKKLRMLRLRTCDCGQSLGYYLEDHYTAEVGGRAILIALANDELRDGVAARPEHGEPGTLAAMVLPRQCEAVRYRDARNEGCHRCAIGWATLFRVLRELRGSIPA